MPSKDRSGRRVYGSSDVDDLLGLDTEVAPDGADVFYDASLSPTVPTLER